MNTFMPFLCASRIGRTSAAGGASFSKLRHVTRPLRWIDAYGWMLIQFAPTSRIAAMHGTIRSVPQSCPLPCVEIVIPLIGGFWVLAC